MCVVLGLFFMVNTVKSLHENRCIIRHPIYHVMLKVPNNYCASCSYQIFQGFYFQIYFYHCNFILVHFKCYNTCIQWLHRLCQLLGWEQVAVVIYTYHPGCPSPSPAAGWQHRRLHPVLVRSQSSEWWQLGCGTPS